MKTKKSLEAIVLAVAVLFAALAASPAFACDCRGVPATICGTEANDLVHGTSASDAIQGIGGHDDIFGNGGNDLICGGGGDDFLWGGSGNDTIFGGGGYDICRGEVVFSCEG